MKNNDGAGATQVRGGDNRKAIDRHAGYSATMSAIESKTRSRHHSSASPYEYKSCCGGSGNDNLKGYGS